MEEDFKLLRIQEQYSVLFPDLLNTELPEGQVTEPFNLNKGISGDITKKQTSVAGRQSCKILL